MDIQIQLRKTKCPSTAAASSKCKPARAPGRERLNVQARGIIGLGNSDCAAQQLAVGSSGQCQVALEQCLYALVKHINISGGNRELPAFRLELVERNRSAGSDRSIVCFSLEVLEMYSIPRENEPAVAISDRNGRMAARHRQPAHTNPAGQMWVAKRAFNRGVDRNLAANIHVRAELANRSEVGRAGDRKRHSARVPEPNAAAY